MEYRPPVFKMLASDIRVILLMMKSVRLVYFER